MLAPRPERPELIDKFKKRNSSIYEKAYGQSRNDRMGTRLMDGGGNTDLKKRIEYDIYYIENFSLSFDLKIIILTIIRGFINKNAY